MSERRRPFRRGRRSRPSGHPPQTPPFSESYGDVDPYLEPMDPSTPTPDAAQIPDARDNMTSPAIPAPSTTPSPAPTTNSDSNDVAPTDNPAVGSANTGAPPPAQQQSTYNPQTGGGQQQGGGQPREREHRHNGRRGRNQRGRGRQRGGGGGGGGQPNTQRGEQQSGPRAPVAPVVPDGETTGWFDPQREGGFIRRSANSYLAEPGDAYVPTQIMRQYMLRRGDEMLATTGHDHRNRVVVVEIQKINGGDPTEAARRPDFGSLIASYPERN